MSYNDFSGNDTAPHPPPPPFGPPVPQPAPPPGDDEADDWFEPVTYDQTDYQDLDAYLAHEAGDSWPPASAAVDVDPYAYADAASFAAPPDGRQRLTSDEADEERAGPDEGWPPRPERSPGPQWAPGPEWAADPERAPGSKRAPDPEWAADPEWGADPEWAARGPRRFPVRVPSLRALSPGRRPRWMLPVAVGLAAAAIGSGVVIITTGGTSRSAAGLPIFSPSPGVTASPAWTSPATAGMSATGQPSAPGASMPGMASPGMTAPGTGAPATLRPPITRARAQQVLAAYTTANNAANATASDPLIATVETGSSLAIDRGIYQGQRARKATGFPAFAPVTARYYIPLEDPASYPHWFAVRVSNAPAARPGTVTSREYIVFTQATARGPWLDAIEPFLRKDIAPPPIALDANGFATAVTAGTPGLSLSPAAISAATAAARDRGTGQPRSPGNLPIDQARAAVLRQLPRGSTAATRHAGTLERVFGLRTADGGALLFYDVAARLTVTAPAGSPLRLDVPGWVAASEGISQARLGYLEQFATYDPPGAKGGQAAIIAAYSGIFRRA
jgi:hypothetical protein